MEPRAAAGAERETEGYGAHRDRQGIGADEVVIGQEDGVALVGDPQPQSYAQEATSADLQQIQSLKLCQMSAFRCGTH